MNLVREDPAPEGHEWRRFVCSDCEFDAHGPFEAVLPVRAGAPRDVAAPLDDCPWCGSRLSLCGQGSVQVGELR